LRTVKKNPGKVLREITNDFNEGGVVRVHPDYTALFTQKISMPFPFQIHNQLFPIITQFL
jgi:hypothetical protein